MDNLINYEPDLIIFQLGENVLSPNSTEESLFENEFIKLVNIFKKSGNPITICTTPFIKPTLIKNVIAENVALATNSYLVDLSHLALVDSTNYALFEKKYLGDKSAWKHQGIGFHPGDYGMENIAKQIFVTINAAIQENKKPTIE